jgi:hypothetical protein
MWAPKVGRLQDDLIFLTWTPKRTVFALLRMKHINIKLGRMCRKLLCVFVPEERGNWIFRGRGGKEI